MYQEARRETAELSVIANAWEKAFLFPFEPQRTLEAFPKRKEMESTNIRPYTPPEVIFRASNGVVHTRTIKTSGNVAEFDDLVHRAEYDSEKPVQLRKLCKAFENMRVYHDNLEATNNEFLQAQQQNSDKPKRSR